MVVVKIAGSVHGLLLGWYLKNVESSYRTSLKKWTWKLY